MRFLIIIVIFLLASCGQANRNSEKKNITSDTLSKPNLANKTIHTLIDKSIKFVWRADKYDEQLKDTLNTIIINEDFCKTISEPERAALGYVATFVGSECNWDGEAKTDFSNLKCKIISALDLGYQCSEKHLGFLRSWFKNDAKVLEHLKDCPEVPFTASSQDTFDEINLTEKSDTIKVWFAANGVNIRMGESWNWTEEDIFVFKNDNLKLVKVNESKVKREKLNIGE